MHFRMSHVYVGSCMCRAQATCNSYSRRRDRINSVLWRSYYKRGGGIWLVNMISLFYRPILDHALFSSQETLRVRHQEGFWCWRMGKRIH